MGEGGGGGMETESMLTPREKSPLLEKILLRGGLNPRRRIKEDSEPSTLQMSYSCPHHMVIQVDL